MRKEKGYMATEERKVFCNISEIQMGMLVNQKQLRNIYGYHIVLTGVKITQNIITGIVSFIGKELNVESNRLEKPVFDFYQDLTEMEEGVHYDE